MVCELQQTDHHKCLEWQSDHHPAKIDISPYREFLKFKAPNDAF